MNKFIKLNNLFFIIIMAISISIVFTACSQPKNQTNETNDKIAQLEENIKKLESEIETLTKQKADLMLELDSIGVPNKIKYVKGYQGKMKVIEETSFKLMPNDISEVLAKIKADTIVEVLAVAEVKTFDPC